MINHEPSEKWSHYWYKKGKVMMYGLSTCILCKKQDNYSPILEWILNIYVDLLNGNEEEIAIKDVKRFNPSISFPIVIKNDERAILGFDEQAILKAFSS